MFKDFPQKTTRRKQFLQQSCIVSLLLSPLLLILLCMYLVSMHNAVANYEKANRMLQEVHSLSAAQQSMSSQAQAAAQSGQVQAAAAAAASPSNANAKQKQGQAQEQQRNLRANHPSLVLQVAETALKPKEADLNTLVLSTSHGDIKIALRPDLSPGSVSYIHRLAHTKLCRRCHFYRAEEEGGFLQGIIANKDVGFNTEKGDCPESAIDVKNECPPWDQSCGCHGPVLKKGMVAWSEGKAGGPDFFINHYDGDATWWGSQHTTFGEIKDDQSMKLLETLFAQPRKAKHNGPTFFEEVIPFEVRLEA